LTKNIDANLLSLIIDDVGKDCFINVKSKKINLVGINGAFHASWFIQTCRGKLEYIVKYIPLEDLPIGENEFEVNIFNG